MRPRRVFVALWVLALLPTVTRGWTGIAHQVVALIAEEHLEPSARAAIQELIDDADLSDAEVVNWADEVRRVRKQTAPWHYVNIPVEALAFDSERDGNGGANVIDALTAQLKTLADRSAAKEKRVEALKFAVHLAGDLHQPLHCAQRNQDAGGNKRLVFFPGGRKAVSLHRVWDELLVKSTMGDRRVLEYAQALDRKVTPQQRKDWSTGTIESWAEEAHRVAVEQTYRDVPADGPPPVLSADYVARGGDAVDLQVTKAGLRLASALNAALAR